MEKFFSTTTLKRWEIISGIVLFIISIGYFSLKDYTKVKPLKVAAATPARCTSTALPLGAIAGQPAPIWCYDKLAKEAPTYKITTNSFSDDFKSTQSFTSCCGGYSIYPSSSTGQATLWRQNNNWYVDTQGASTMIRPNKQFTFENGKLIVEADISSSMSQYSESIISEIIITTANKPTVDTQSLFASQKFEGNWTLGCRLIGTTQSMACSLSDNTKTGSSSIYEKVSTNSNVSTKKVWKQCKSGESFSQCQNSYRLEISRTAITLQVNGTRYIEQLNIPPLPDALLKGNVYVYFASTNLENPKNTYRFHWGKLAVNPVIMKPTIKSTTPTKSPTPTPLLSSIQFKGEGSARISHASYYNVPKAWTLEAWIKDEHPDGYNHKTQYIITKGATETTENIPYIMGIEYDNLFVGTRNNGINKVITYNLPNHNISPKAWHHIAATYDDKTDKLIVYIDGVSVLESIVSTYTTEGNKQPLFIGKNGSKDFWYGNIDDVRIWEVARTAQEIRDSYQIQFTSPQKNLIGNWRFDEGKGNMSFDLSEKKEHATIIKGIWSRDIQQSL